MMPRIPLAARMAALLAAGAACLPVAAATASATADMRVAGAAGATVRTAAAERAIVRVGGPAAAPATSTAAGFLGISTSLSTISVLSGPAADPDTPFIHLLANLSPGAPFLLRMGGVSADTSWWPIPGMKMPRYITALTPRWASDLRALLTALGGKAILGVNLEEGPRLDPRIARAEIAGFNRYVGADLIDAFELGNEPEFYPLSVVNGGRGHDTFAAYGQLFSQIASQLGGAPLAGPGVVGTRWLAQLGTVLRDMRTHLTLATVHAYPMKNCSRLAHLSMPDFFTRAAIQGLADSIRGAVTAATAHGEPLRVDELNGITCGGKAGLSNSFGEALWALNALPALWHAGVQGVNFQTVDGHLNQMITARHSASGWRVSVEPVYYGLLAFAGVAPAGSRLLRISSSTADHLYRFAVRTPDGSERVVLTNVGSAARMVGVRASGARGAGSVALLSARSLGATRGTTLGGRRVSARTGQLTGTPRLTRVMPNPTGVYAVRVPAHAAAILTLVR